MGITRRSEPTPPPPRALSLLDELGRDVTILDVLADEYNAALHDLFAPHLLVASSYHASNRGELWEVVVYLPGPPKPPGAPPEYPKAADTKLGEALVSPEGIDLYDAVLADMVQYAIEDPRMFELAVAHMHAVVDTALEHRCLHLEVIIQQICADPGLHRDTDLAETELHDLKKYRKLFAGRYAAIWPAHTRESGGW